MSPLFALALLVCVLFCGLTIDIGRMELLKIQMQSASDAAALGAELESERASPGNFSTFDWATHGQQDAALNGFTNGVNGATVTIAQDPTNGPYAGRYDAIQATITQTFTTLFMGSLNGGSYTLTTQSVALVPTCNYFLGGFNSSYSYSVDYASAGLNGVCPAYANYNYAVDGFAKTWGFGWNVAGVAVNSYYTGWTTQESEGPAYSPQINATFGVPVVTDPFATSVTQPTFSSCNYVSKTISAATVTLNPGTYCGTASTVGLTITNSTVTLNPGLYIFTGGATWNSSTITGTGVTLFFTKGNGAGYGQFQSSSSSPCTLSLSAPVDTSNGGITAILFFADRSWVATSWIDFIFNTNGSFSGDGIFYLPNAGMFIWQNSWNVPTYGSFVVRNIYVYNTSTNLSGNYSWLTGGSPFRKTGVLVQ